MKSRKKSAYISLYFILKYERWHQSKCHCQSVKVMEKSKKAMYSELFYEDERLLFDICHMISGMIL